MLGLREMTGEYETIAAGNSPVILSFKQISFTLVLRSFTILNLPIIQVMQNQGAFNGTPF